MFVQRECHRCLLRTLRLLRPGLSGLGGILIAPDALGGGWTDADNEKAAVWLTKSAMKTYEIDKKKVDLVRLQDDVAQVGQGLIAERDGERLGRADVGVIAIRRLWARELAAFREGRPLKQWRRDASIVPRAWGLAGNPARIGGEGAGTAAVAEVIDVRPHVEIAEQLKALHAVVK